MVNFVCIDIYKQAKRERKRESERETKFFDVCNYSVVVLCSNVKTLHHIFYEFSGSHSFKSEYYKQR